MPDRHDEEDDNFANGFNDCMLRDGRAVMTGDLDMGNFKVKKVANGTVSTDAVNKSQLDKSTTDVTSALTTLLNKLWKIGDIKASVKDANHDNWFLCNGQAINRITYSELFALIGTKFGSGDGTTTFNLPDYRGKFLRGLGGNSAPTMYETQGESVPAHTHYIANGDSGGSQNVTINSGNSLTQEGGSSATQAISYRLNGTNTTPSKGKTSNASETLYSGSHVTPINQAVNYFIKVKEEA